MLIFNRYEVRLFTLPMLPILLLLSACSSSVPEANVTPLNYEFFAVGYAAIAAQQGESADVKMLNAIKASKLEAYKELAEQVYGVMLTSESNVHQYQLQDDTLKVGVSGLVRGAKVLRTYHEGDLYITELGLNTNTLPFLKQAEFADNESVINVPSQVYY
ncbi:flagellar biosynthesis protein FlgP [Psychromonas sp.]|nr:flagellar biosynthesis protein FlgP [Psychromonas sp.]